MRPSYALRRVWSYRTDHPPNRVRGETHEAKVAYTITHERIRPSRKVTSVVMALPSTPRPSASPQLIAYHILPEAEWLCVQPSGDDRGVYTD